jgi:hypothetical protein
MSTGLIVAARASPMRVAAVPCRGRIPSGPSLS